MNIFSLKRFLVLFLFLFFFILNTKAQSSKSKTQPKPKAKSAALYAKAMQFLADDNYNSAVPLLQKAIEIDTNYLDAYLSLAGVYGEVKQYKQSVYLYEIVQRKDAAYFFPYQLPYSINLAGLGRFDSALAAINLFLTIPDLDDVGLKSAKYRKRCYEFAVDYAMKHANTHYTFNPHNLGDSVNSPESEYLPTLSVDDSLLVFTRREKDGGEYFYRSHQNANNHFSPSARIRGTLNQEAFKGAITVSANGEWLVFAGNIAGKTYGSFDLYLCYNTPSGWSEPENLGNNINTEFWESTPTLSPDNRALYFSSKRTGGFGGADLYVSYRDAQGKWGEAINLGPTINTIGDEQAPFIHADNQTLYFTSNGLTGYGGSDLFVIRSSSNNKWSSPENLGYPINTIENEGSMAVAPNSVDAYYASDRTDSRGGLDLYQFELRKDVRPRKTLYVKGFVYDMNTKKGLPSNVELIDNTTGNPLMNVQTDETGFYFITLPVGEDFTFTVNRKGYLFFSKNYQLQDKVADSTYRENIFLKPITIHAKMVLKNILFGIKDATLKDVSKIELDNAVKFLKDNSHIHVLIQGHTDNKGNANDNLLLSNNRAKAVVDYFIEKGIDKNRLTFKGLGSTLPIADNNTEEGRAINRRTTMIITEM